MSNPIMTGLEKEVAKTPNGYPSMPGYQVGGEQHYAPGQPYVGQGQELDYEENQEFARLAASMQNTTNANALTIDDVYLALGSSFGILLTSAAISWVAMILFPGMAMAVALFSALLAFGTVVFSTFSKKVRRGPTLAYAVFEGVFLGAISKTFEMIVPGVVIQAVLATLIVAAVCFLLYRSGLVKVNSTFMKVLIVGMISLLAYVLIVNLLGMFNVISMDTIRNATIFGFPLSIVVGLVAIVLASMSLIADFDLANKMVAQGVDKKYAWHLALGFMVTLVWLYLEILRLLAILQSND